MVNSNMPFVSCCDCIVQGKDLVLIWVDALESLDSFEYLNSITLAAVWRMDDIGSREIISEGILTIHIRENVGSRKMIEVDISGNG